MTEEQKLRLKGVIGKIVIGAALLGLGSFGVYATKTLRDNYTNYVKTKPTTIFKVEALDHNGKPFESYFSKNRPEDGEFTDIVTGTTVRYENTMLRSKDTVVAPEFVYGVD